MATVTQVPQVEESSLGSGAKAPGRPSGQRRLSPWQRNEVTVKALPVEALESMAQAAAREA